MALTARLSNPRDREEITQLLVESLGLDRDSTTIAPEYQDWKYWAPHPLYQGSRSRILLADGNIVAHGCIWPVLLQGPFGELPALHLIDWVARRSVPGAGLRLLRSCSESLAASLAIGGSEMTKKIIPAFGFKPYNWISFFSRPLRPSRVASLDSVRDWKTPARIARSLLWSVYPRVRMPPGWRADPVSPAAIPDSLWPTFSNGVASVRNASLLQHMIDCPVPRKTQCYLLRKDASATAYFCLVFKLGQAKLVDYGPSGLSEGASYAMAVASQEFARSENCDVLSTASTEPSVQAGLALAGLRLTRQIPLMVLKNNPLLKAITDFRLTLLDYDGAV